MNKDNKKVVVVVVTCNRKNLLLECLQGILNQTYPINKIVLIDNASTDGTEKMVKENFSNNEAVLYIKFNENTGSSGGFHEGIKRAYEKEADLIWVMDDDCIPNKDALEKLIEKYHFLKEENNIGFLCSQVNWIDGNPHIVNIPAIPLISLGKPFSYFYKIFDDIMLKMQSKNLPNQHYLLVQPMMNKYSF